MALAPADTGSETTTQIDRAGVLSGRRFAASLGLDAATLFGLATVVSLLVLIEILVRTGAISSLIIALPSEAIGAIFHGETFLKLVQATKLTFGMVLAAMVAEVVIAIPAGYLLYRYKAFGKAYEGWLASLFAAPIFLLYPLFMVIFGRNNFTLIFMGMAAGIIPIIVHVRLAFTSIPPTLIKVGRSFHMSESTIFWKIMVPAGAKTIFTGIRLGLIYTLINIIAIEYLVDAGGLGRMVSDSYFRFDITGTYTAIIAVTLVSVVFNIIVNRIEKLVR
ncbi:ABC transporter permease [uncultured Bosea sp.]|uniref:ABC transporter permease n=1 Tax=uncultured Bosea sp. TaxID=211457 RepID=UPI0025F25B69|nr:ABC transporter permease subunit [uncultured Bosea sp.]